MVKNGIVICQGTDGLGWDASLDFVINCTAVNYSCIAQVQMGVLVSITCSCLQSGVLHQHRTCTKYPPLSVCPTASPFDSLLGPLLPEQLDVRNIPVSKGREVTINLSGKCYVFV